MRLVLITVITLQLLLEERLTSSTALPQVPSTDPCEDGPCGKGAECKSMGSIAICVCPNDGTGDPFESCMQQVENEKGSSTPSSNPGGNQFVGSFDVGSVHEKARASPTAVKTTTAKPSSSTTRSTTTSSPTSSASISTFTPTTRNPYVHVFDSSTSRPATVGHSYHGSHHQQNDGSNQPESHRIPIINHSSNPYPSHEYPPRPINGGMGGGGGGSTYSPSYPYHGSSSNPGSGGGSSYELFNEKTVAPGSGPIADYGGGSMGGGTTPYMYRGSATHMSGSHNAYEYDSRPITPTTSTHHYQHHSPPHSNTNNMDRYGHHGYHPSSSGFPDPITESSASYSRYATSSSSASGGMMGSSTSGSTYDIYNYNPLRNDLSSSSHHGHHGSGNGFDRIADPMGKYDNCRSVNGIVVCADNTNAHSYHHNRDPTPHYDRGEMKTTSSYGFNSNMDRDRDRFSSYYPSRHSSSSTSHRPMSDYAYNVNRQGYPYDQDYHGSRQPIDSSDRMGAASTSSSYYPHSFLPKEQRISAQSTLTINSDSNPAGVSSTTTRNDNDNPLCKSMCGVNSVCRLVLDRPVCGCPQGHTGDPSVRCTAMYGTSGGSIGGGGGGNNGGGSSFGFEECQRHVDCKQSEICAKNKCIDPCKEQGLMSSSSVNFIGVGGNPGGGESICGSHAECLVVRHTPVCKCHDGYFGNPYVACVP